MTRALSTLMRSPTLPVADTRTDGLIRGFTNRLEDDSSDWRRRAIPARLAPTEAERAVLVDRVEVIDAWLTPSRADAIKRVVGMVRGLMASASVGDVHQVLDGYAMVLKPFPEPVVEDVCQRFLDGRLGNRVYAPTPAEIAHECRLAVAEALAERGRIMLILDAEVYGTPGAADQQKIQERHAEFVRETVEARRAPSGPLFGPGKHPPDARDPQPDPIEPTRDALKGLTLSEASIARGVKIENAEPSA